MFDICLWLKHVMTYQQAFKKMLMVCLWPYNLETTLNGIRISGVLTIADSKDIGLELKNKKIHADD